jgi:hypothetical protein
MSEETLRKQLYDSYANRAHIYHLLFKELRAELGAEKAADLMGRAIRQRGVQNAGKYASFAPRNLEGLRQAFDGNMPDDGAMFAPEVVRCDTEALDIKFHRCSLKQAWLDAGLSQEEVATLCRIAAQVMFLPSCCPPRGRAVSNGELRPGTDRRAPESTVPAAPMKVAVSRPSLDSRLPSRCPRQTLIDLARRS